MMVTRRGVLLSIGGSVGLLALGTSDVIFRTDYTLELWIREVVQRHLSGVDIPADVLQEFSSQILRDGSLDTVRKRALSFLEIFLPVANFPVSHVQDRIRFEERRIVTIFLTQTNALHLSDLKSEADAIEYIGPQLACGNPFAEFD